MADIFAPIPLDLVDSDPLKIYATKFGDGTTIDVAKLATAKHESDTFIDQLQRENAEMRKQVSSQATMDEIMTQIKALGPKTPALVEPHSEPPKTPATADELEVIVANLLKKRQSEDLVKSNTRLVEEKVLAKWGADAQVNINRKAKELGVSVEHLQKIALETPTVFFALTGLDKEVQTPAPIVAPRSRDSGPAPTPTGGERTAKFYADMRQRNPTEYFSKKTQQQQMKDALALGERYFDA